MTNQNQPLIPKRLKPFLYLPVLLGVFAMFSFQSVNSFSLDTEDILIQDTMSMSYLDTVIAWDADLDKSMVTVNRVFPGVLVTSKDTIMVYDYDTDEETVKVVESEHIKKEVILHREYFGTYMTTDTIVIFDPKTKMEFVEYVQKKALKTKEN